MEDTRSNILEQLAIMQDVRALASQMMTEMAVEAVKTHSLTRKMTAEALDVHPITVSRWITATAVEAPEESDRNYPPVTS